MHDHKQGHVRLEFCAGSRRRKRLEDPTETAGVGSGSELRGSHRDPGSLGETRGSQNVGET